LLKLYINFYLYIIYILLNNELVFVLDLLYALAEDANTLVIKLKKDQILNRYL